MIVCPKCGTRYPNNPSLCIKCGTRLVIPNPPQQKPNQASNPYQNRPVQPQQNRPVQPQGRPIQPQQSRPVQPQNRPIQPQQNIPVQPQGRPVQQNPMHQNRPAQLNNNASRMDNPYNKQVQNQQGQAVATNNDEKKKKTIIAVVCAIIAFVLIFTILTTTVFAARLSGHASDSNIYYSEPAGSIGDSTGDSYTLMVYMVGSDLETNYKAASLDIEEMMGSNINLDHTNVIIYAGGATTWWNGLSSSNKNYVKLAEGENGNIELVEEQITPGSQNMGKAESFSEFLNYCDANYPADHMALICWDHGGGPMGGYGVDEIYSDHLDLDELYNGFMASPFNGTKKLDWLGFDACLMGSVEIAQSLSGFARYLIASEEVENAAGWDYNFLSVINQTSDPVEIGKTCVDYYYDYYTNNYDYYEHVDATLSLLDLSKASQAYDSVLSFTESMTRKLEEGDYSVIEYNSPGAKEFGVSSGGTMCLYDIQDLVERYENVFPTEVSNIKNALSEIVVSNRSNVENCCGLSTYCSIFESYGYYSDDSSDYGSYYSDRINPNFDRQKAALKNRPAVKWSNPTVEVGADSATVKLTPEQRTDMTEAYYTILYDTGEVEGEVYTPVVEKVKISPDSNNVLTVPLSPNVCVASSKVDDTNLSQIVFPITQVSSDKNVDTYNVKGGYVKRTGEYFLKGEYQAAGITFTVDNDNKLSIKQFAYRNGNTVEGKNTIDADDWGYTGYAFYRYINDQSKTRFYKDWETDGYTMFSTIPLGDFTYFDFVPTSETTENFICQIVVKDSKGNEYVTDTFELQNQYNTKAVKLSTTSTKNGEMKFEVYDDHAKLIRYEGGDTKVEVPAEVDGVKVTEIGSAAFGTSLDSNEILSEVTLPDSIEILDSYSLAYCSKLTNVNVPDGIKAIPDDCFFEDCDLENVTIPSSVEFIGRFAFASSGIKSIDIPKKVSAIGIGVFADAPNLQSITINGGNSNKWYSVIDGVLIDTETETAIAGYVKKGATSFTVPDEVTDIQAYAFYNMSHDPIILVTEEDTLITSLKLPSELKTIGDFAFTGFSYLDKIELPESLVSIGDSAFGSALFLTKKSLDVHIGKNLTDITYMPFAGYTDGKITVDSANPVFSEVNGKLANKAGDTLIPVFEADEQKSTDGTYYDMKGNEYSNKADVLYYDRDGNSYKYDADSSSYVNTATNEAHKSLDSHIDAAGYMVFIDYDKIHSARMSPNGDLIFNITEAYIGKDGKLVRNSIFGPTEFYDKNGKKYSSVLDVPYYDADGNCYKMKNGEYGVPSTMVDEKSGNILEMADCYLQSDGTLLHTKSSTYKFVIVDDKNNKYYYPDLVSWSKDGVLDTD